MAADDKPRIKHDILVRVRWLYLVFVLIGAAIFGKVLFLQLGPDSGRYRELADEITYYRDTLFAQRGEVLARDGRVLATVIPKYELRMDFAAAGLSDTLFDNNVDELARRLAVFFRDTARRDNRTAEWYRNLMVDARADRSKHRYTRFAPRRVDYNELQALRRMPIFDRRGTGLIAEPGNERVYPHGSLARRTVGFTVMGRDTLRVGIEGAFDEQLRGRNGGTMVQRVSGRVRIPIPDESNREPVDGLDVVSTIDIELQDVAEKALRTQLTEQNADWGSVILMEVATGEIRVMSNLTRHADGSVTEDYNYAVGRAMDPGSTFKLATLIALLEKGGVTLDSMVDTGSGLNVMVGRAKITDDQGHRNMGVVDLRTVFRTSSNIGFARLAYERFGDNPSAFTDVVSGLAMDRRVDMQIRGAATPTVWKPGDRYWSGIALQQMAYGYGLNITPMHTLMLYNAVANGGRMVRPLLVRELRRFGVPVLTYPTETVVERICSPATLAAVQECLRATVDDGTARILQSPYYTAAAKTGTAQVSESRSGYTQGSYLATLVGYFPAESPKYSCIVVIKTTGKVYYGAALAGPVMKAVSDRVYASQLQWQTPISRLMARSGGPIPMKPGPTKRLAELSRALSVRLDVPRNTGAWAAVEGTERGRAGATALDTPAGVMPSVEGMGLQDAVYVLEARGLRVDFSGVGAVVSQSIAPGTPIRRGAAVSIKLGNRKRKPPAQQTT